MATLEVLLKGRRTNAILTWGVVGALVLVLFRFVRRGDFLWVGMSLVILAVVVVPPTVGRHPVVVMPWELLTLAVLPVLGRGIGVGVHVAPFLAVAGLALLLAVDLDAFTSLELTPRFSVIFVVITTMAFAGLWVLGAWGADTALGTDHLSTVDELMWDLLIATATGVIAGLLFELYFRRVDPTGDVFGTDGSAAESSAGWTAGANGSEGERVASDGQTASEEDEEVEGKGSSTPTDSVLPHLAVPVMQFGLVSIAAVGLLRREFSLVVNSLAPLAVTFLPGLLRRESGYAMNPWLVLWLTVAAVLHAGGALGLYRSIGWYDQVAHAVSGALVAGTGYAIARAVELHTDDVTFNAKFRGLFVVLFVLSVGVFWEVMEFSTGLIAGILGGQPVLAQYGLDDIALDLLFTGVGGVLVAFFGTDRFRRMARAIRGRAGVLGRRQAD